MAHRIAEIIPRAWQRKSVQSEHKVIADHSWGAQHGRHLGRIAPAPTFPMSREAHQPATPNRAGGFSRTNRNASASGAGRPRGGPLRSLSTTASDAALIAQLQVSAELSG